MIYIFAVLIVVMIGITAKSYADNVEKQEQDMSEISRLSSENKRISTENMFLREVIDSIAGGHSEDPQFDALKVKAALEPVSEGLATCEHPGITRKWHCTECDDEITDTDKYRDPA